jgi:hypothetical protein
MVVNIQQEVDQAFDFKDERFERLILFVISTAGRNFKQFDSLRFFVSCNISENGS